MSEREPLLREAHRLVDELQRTAAAKGRVELGPGPRERETGINPFAEGAELPAPPAAPSQRL